MQFQCAPVAER